MKKGFLLSSFFLLSSLAWCQSENKVTLKKSYSEIDFAPNISGYYEGDIPCDYFCSPEGLVNRKGLKIITFDIYYCKASEKGVHVVGSSIPDSICVQVQRFCLYDYITINNVKSVDEDGSIKNLSPLLLRVVRKADE